MPWLASRHQESFTGWIAGLGTDSGHRLVVGATSDEDWVRDSYMSPTLVSIGLTDAYGPAFAAAHEAAVSAGTIEQLYILFDEGTDTPTRETIAAAGFVYLDNITVTLNGVPTVFTGPMDNGKH